MDFQAAYNLVVPVVEKKDFRSLLTRGGERLQPRPIPRFTPQKFASRWSF